MTYRRYRDLSPKQPDLPKNRKGWAFTTTDGKQSKTFATEHSCQNSMIKAAYPNSHEKQVEFRDWIIEQLLKNGWKLELIA